MSTDDKITLTQNINTTSTTDNVLTFSINVILSSVDIF